MIIMKNKLNYIITCFAYFVATIINVACIIRCIILHIKEPYEYTLRACIILCIIFAIILYFLVANLIYYFKEYKKSKVITYEKK